MIKITNLKKTYKSGKGISLALDNVTFNIKEKGLVFILGKSGSGKSTLLNILGTLDEKTIGTITISGENYDNFKQNELDSFRNDYIGFIFQDCCLIESINVYDNLRLVLDLQKEKNDAIIYQSLERVGLKGLEKRYPNQLSAGQRQRVAIARALVKRPRIILADEPTGNVDSNTGKLILDILKELSTNCLILLVSHNQDDAFRYADRIIEIKDGKIISDEKRVCKYIDEFKISDEVIQIPFYDKLTDSEIGQINDHIQTCQDIKFLQNKPGFEEYIDEEELDYKIEFKNKRLSSFNVLKYSRKFYKKRVKLSIFTIFLTSVLLIVLGLCQLFVSYSPQKELQKHLEGNNIMFVGEGVKKDANSELDKTRTMYVSDQKKELIEDSSDKKQLYDVLKLQINCKQPWNFHTTYYNQSHVTTFYLNSGFPYVEASNYLLVTNLDFIKEVLNVNGELEILAGTITDNDDKVIITDYIADALIRFGRARNYDSIINNKFISSNSCRIGAIIKTDYKEKYQSFFDEIKGDTTKIDKSDERFLDFSNDVFYKYSWLFTINSNFLDAYKIAYQTIDDTTSQRCSYYYTDCVANGNKFDENTNIFYQKDGLKEDEIAVTYGFINKYWEKEYVSQTETSKDLEKLYKGKTVKLSFSDGNKKVFEKEFKIADIELGKETDIFWVSNDILTDLKMNSIYRIGLVSTSKENTYNINNVAEGNNMYIYDVKISFYTKLLNVVSVFKGVFVYISVIICIGIIAAIFLDALNNIKRNRHNIGIIRSLGGKISDLVRIFLHQTLFNGLFITIITILGIKFGSRIINDILVKSLAKIFNVTLPRGFCLVSFNVYVAIGEIVIMFLLNIISSVLQILSIRKIKPINIIRSNNN